MFKPKDGTQKVIKDTDGDGTPNLSQEIGQRIQNGDSFCIVE